MADQGDVTKTDPGESIVMAENLDKTEVKNGNGTTHTQNQKPKEDTCTAESKKDLMNGTKADQGECIVSAEGCLDKTEVKNGDGATHTPNQKPREDTWNTESKNKDLMYGTKADQGECIVKAEYLDIREVKSADGTTHAPRGKLLGGRNKNKDRPAPMKFSKSSKLCGYLNNRQEGDAKKECTFPNCAFQHDPEKYLESKLPDIAETCHVFQTYGICENGLACRFASSHIKDKKYNVVNKEICKDEKTYRSHETNHCSFDLKMDLRKKNYEFTTDAIVNKIYNERADDIKQREIKEKEERDKKNDENKNDEPESKKMKIEEPEPKKMKIEEPKSEKMKIEPEHDQIETKEKRIPKKKIDWENKLYLAPLTTVGNLPFRRICKKYGADITCGEMAMTQQLLQAHPPEWALVQRHECEDIFGIQVCGCQPHQMGRVAQLVEDGHIDVDFVDINLGCPIDMVYKRGMGSGLMGRKKPLEVMVKSMSQILNRPLTVKIRTGIYMDKPFADKLAPNLFEWGADLVTLHGRSREQRYTKLANWDYIGEVAKAVSPKPLFGNGDIINYEDYNEFKSKSGAAGCMLARGALVKPWVFTEIKEQRHWDISAQERLDMIRDYVNYGLEHWGSDDKGVETTRRFLLEWLSFLHRYVPVGILEKPPQRMNERVPEYHGRGDIETLLASPKCSDWISITEMFLGKVPEGHRFEPKHKAHGYRTG